MRTSSEMPEPDSDDSNAGGDWKGNTTPKAAHDTLVEGKATASPTKNQEEEKHCPLSAERLNEKTWSDRPSRLREADDIDLLEAQINVHSHKNLHFAMSTEIKLESYLKDVASAFTCFEDCEGRLKVEAVLAQARFRDLSHHARGSALKRLWECCIP